MLIFSLNYLFLFKNYLSISYRSDIIWKYINTYPNYEIIPLCEHQNSWPVLPNKMNMDLENDNIIKSPKFNLKIINCYYYPVKNISKFNKFISANNQKFLEVKSHYLNFKAYQYEGFNINKNLF